MSTPAMPRPFVSCVMPTADRPDFVPRAIRYFQRQDYDARELVIVDDGLEPVGHLVPDDPQIRYLRIPRQRTLGEKRNACVEASSADLIMHWDDDDWMSPNRISMQVESLLRSAAEVCGLTQMLFYDRSSGQTWLYDYPHNQRPWLAGGSLLYTKDFWKQSPFPAAQVASDTTFVWSHNLNRMAVTPDYKIYVAMIHPGNTCPKNVRGAYWTPWTGDIRRILGDDFQAYAPRHMIGVTGPQPRTPLYSIIMAAHNALAMTQLATLRTLRHSANCDARLVVVDNASTDGTERWLDSLARRGDIDLLRNESNVGHGPALEQGRRHTRSRYIVTLDSDAFPISDDWLGALTARLTGNVKVAGVQHHRDYIHPSCLLIERETLDRFGLDFLNQKDRPSHFDVAESISVDLKRRGFDLGRLQRTSALRRGSISEPVYLASEYEGLVHHQWYTTRAAVASGAQVDDVPADALSKSLEEVIARHRSEARPLTVVVGLSVGPLEPERLRNARVCLEALNIQTLPRWRYRIVLVEQGVSAAVEDELAPLVDVYQFAFNPGPYNRGWGFNVGAFLPGGEGGGLCLIDADLLVGPDFLARGLEALQSAQRAFLPYREVVYLDSPSTDRAISAFRAAPLRTFDESELSGRIFSSSQGGCIWVDAPLYRATSGHDERFRGWGREDREFCDRLERVTNVGRLAGRMLHLDHPRPAEEGEWALANAQLYERITASPVTRTDYGSGNPRLYAYDFHEPDPLLRSQRARDWENWHTWAPNRIATIVHDELDRAQDSARARLIGKVAALGETILDAGCGPGALWPHLRAHAPRVRWTGIDVTWKMIATAHLMFPDVPVGCADATCLPFKDSSFDVVMLRHVLEHLPQPLMERALHEAARVAARAVVVDFYLPPELHPRRTRRVGENFLETRWTAADIESPVLTAQWKVSERFRVDCREESDEVWILAPGEPRRCDARPAVAAEQKLKITIIMPTYRRPHTIFRTIATIQAQTHRNWELIVIDNSRETNYEFDDARIRTYRHPEVTSASYARNQGLRYATGDLVCFFDDDDDMFPEYLQTFAENFTRFPAAKMVRCGMLVSDNNVNYTYATPESCLRREFAKPLWTSRGPAHDQLYFATIVAQNRWSEANGDIIMVHQALCRANSDRCGGLRGGWF